jgi:hypothetical protein
MSSQTVDWHREAEAARQRLAIEGGVFAAGVSATIANTADLGESLDSSAAKIRELKLIPEPKPGTSPDTLYLWLNDAVFNPGGCFVAAQAADHTRADPSFPPPLSNRVGYKLGDVQGGSFAFAGLEPILNLFAEYVIEDPPPGAELGADLILALVCAAISDALAERLDFPYRVALSRSQQMRTMTWEIAAGAWVSEIHTS